MVQTVIVPNNLVLEQSISFVNDLRMLPNADEYIFDFKNVGRIEPFALLFLSSEIKRCRNRMPYSNFRAINFDRCSYAAHMGFFKAFGVDYGNMPGEAAGSLTYVPITIFSTKAVRDEAAAKYLAPAKLLETKAREMCQVLTQSDNGVLFDTLVFSIREILRNVIEHSHSEQFGICAQYWPSLSKVALAILDRGRGIKASLSNNPHLIIGSDLDAIRLSLQPGISGTAFKGAYSDPDDAWANSGYGLYMTSNLCKAGGSFFVASGSTGLYMSENKERIMDTTFEGTALNLTLNTDRLTDLSLMLDRLRKTAANLSDLVPSASSIGLT